MADRELHVHKFCFDAVVIRYYSIIQIEVLSDIPTKKLYLVTKYRNKPDL